MAAAGEAAVIGKSFGETHADSGADTGGHADEKRVPAFVSGDGSGEKRSERGNGTVHQASETGLNNLKEEKAALRFGFLLANIFGKISALQFFGLRDVRLLFVGQIVEQLADAGVLRTRGGFLIEAAGFQFHYADLFADSFEINWLEHPERFALDEPTNFLAANDGNMLAEFLLVKLDEPAAMIGFFFAHAF